MAVENQIFKGEIIRISASQNKNHKNERTKLYLFVKNTSNNIIRFIVYKYENTPRRFDYFNKIIQQRFCIRDKVEVTYRNYGNQEYNLLISLRHIL